MTAAEERAEHIRQLIAAAPPLRPDQKDRLAVALRDDRGGSKPRRTA